MRKVFYSSIIFCLLLTTLVAERAQALELLQFGVRGGYYEDFEEGFLGADVKMGFAMFDLNPNLEWIFVQNANAFTLNVDGTMTIFPIPLLDPYVGGGVGYIYTKPDGFDATNDFGLNLIAGLGLNVVLNPYVQLKYVISDNNTWVFVLGVHF